MTIYQKTKLVATSILLGIPFYTKAASTYSSEMEDFQKAAGLQYRPPEVVVGDIINGFLGFLGVIFMILIIYAGFTWMTAQGNEEKVSQAKTTIASASVGLMIVILAYFITAFVIQLLIDSGL